MQVKVGDVVKFWHGLGGTRLRSGVVTRIERVYNPNAPEEAVEQLPALEIDEHASRHFVDLADGAWTYADSIIEVNGQKV